MAASDSGAKGSTAQQPSQRSHVAETSAGTASDTAARARSAQPVLSSLTIPLPDFPVLPPSVPAPDQTFQTPSQVSAILSLPPPLLMQLARTDSPVEQRHIAEKRGVRSYLSAMAIPPPSPTSFVESIARENARGIAGFGSATTSEATTSALRGTASSGPDPSVAAQAKPALSIPLSIPLSLPNFSSSVDTSASLAVSDASTSRTALTPSTNGEKTQAQLALPLLLGQVFAPPPLTPGVLAPIPGFGSVSSLFTSTIGANPLPPDAGSQPTSPTSPRVAFAPSVDDWSFHTATQRAAASGAAQPGLLSSEPTAAAAAGSGAGPADAGTLDLGDLARQIKDWALETQERQVEAQVAEAKAAAVLLATQVQAQAHLGGEGEVDAPGAAATSTAADGAQDHAGPSSAGQVVAKSRTTDGDGLQAYADAYKQQLDALASGYFAQLHRDALRRLEDETRGRTTARSASADALGGQGAAQGQLASSGDGSQLPDSSASGWSLPHGTSSSWSAQGTASLALAPHGRAAESMGATVPLSSSQAPTLKSLTALTSSRTQAEAMHVRASAAAAVAAQVMAAQDLARSAGQKLAEYGVDPRRVVEEVGGLVDRDRRRSAGAAEPGAGLDEIIGKAVAGASSRRASQDDRVAQSSEMQRTTSGGGKSDAMSIEEVGKPALPATSTAALQAAEAIEVARSLGSALASTAGDGQASIADLASLPHADKPPSTIKNAAPSASDTPHVDSASAASQQDAATPQAAQGGVESAAAAVPATSYGIPGQANTAAEYAALATPEKRDYLLTYAHQLYSTDPRHVQLLPLLHTIEALHPDHLPTLLLISCVYYSRGELDSSLYYNKRLLHIDPSYVRCRSLGLFRPDAKLTVLSRSYRSKRCRISARLCEQWASGARRKSGGGRRSSFGRRESFSVRSFRDAF